MVIRLAFRGFLSTFLSSFVVFLCERICQTADSIISRFYQRFKAVSLCAPLPLNLFRRGRNLSKTQKPYFHFLSCFVAFLSYFSLLSIFATKMATLANSASLQCFHFGHVFFFKSNIFTRDKNRNGQNQQAQPVCGR